jgi:hypothetical protein
MLRKKNPTIQTSVGSYQVPTCRVWIYDVIYKKRIAAYVESTEFELWGFLIFDLNENSCFSLKTRLLRKTAQLTFVKNCFKGRKLTSRGLRRYAEIRNLTRQTREMAYFH